MTLINDLKSNICIVTIIKKKFLNLRQFALVLIFSCLFSACGGSNKSNNTEPSISGAPTTLIKTGGSYLFAPTSHDAEGDKLTFRIDNKPSWATFNTDTGVLSGSPSNIGEYKNIVIYVSDGRLETSLLPFNISVIVDNKAPTITGVPINLTAIGSLYTFTPTAYDSNNDKLKYRIENMPSWATFNTETGTLNGTPDTVGQHSNIIIYVTDGELETSLAPFSISVTSNASTSDIQIESNHAGVTPFISFLQINGESLLNITAVKYTIQPKTESTSKAVSVTYKLDALKNRNYLDLTNKKLTIPVFGLYSAFNNQILLEFTFADNSSQTLSTVISTEIFADANKIYDQPVFIKKRSINNALGFDFFVIKSRFGTPIVIDTDGEIRWLGAKNSSGISSIFINNSFIVGAQDSTKFQQIELDGSVVNRTLASSNYINFHHNIDNGKSGMLAHFDSSTDIESIVSEFTMDGSITKEWNFANILNDYMSSQGDTPSNFIRRGVDWFHSNAATYDPRDNSLIVSSRENFLIKVNYDTGEIIWILGDPTKYWYTFPSLRKKALKLNSGIYPIGQHSTSITKDGLLMVFNDGAASFGQPTNAPAGESRNYSAVSAYQINDAELTAKEAWRFEYNRSILSDICSSSYEASDGSLLITYSVADNRTKSRLVGLNKNHDVVFDLEYPSTVCNTAWNAEPIKFENIIF